VRCLIVYNRIPAWIYLGSIALIAYVRHLDQIENAKNARDLIER